MTLDLKESALRYLSLGCSIIPLSSDKKPLLTSWKEFQGRRPSTDEVQGWFDELNPQGVAIVTGAISGVVVLDVEAGADISSLALPPTVTAKTGGGGWHFYFRPPSDLTLGNAVRFRPAMDFKGEGGYVVAPPSLHPSGKRYEWAVSFDDADVAPLPAWLTQEVQAPRQVSRPWEEIISGVPEGQRNQSAASVAGTLLARFPPDEWEVIGWPAMIGWNRKNNPPLSEHELRNVWESIRRTELNKRTPPHSRPEAPPHPTRRREPRGTAATSAILPDGAVAEMVYDPVEGHTQFAVWSEGLVNYEEQLTVGEQRTLRPYSPENTLIRNEIVLFPSKAEPYESEQALVEEIQAFIHHYVQLTPIFEKLAAYYVLFSWLYDSFNELPYLRAKGDTGSGKTRFLLTVGSICYKPTFASGASTVSPIFRILDLFRGTLVIDEGDFRFSDEKAEVIKILNNGNARGFPVLRSESVGRRGEFSPRAYQVYGPKLVGTRGAFQDRALESRCLTEELGNRKLRGDIPINLPLEFKIEARTLRNKLLWFRLANQGRATVNPSLVDEALEPRLNQVFVPLLSVIHDDEARRDLKKVLREYQRQLVADRGLEVEALVVEAIREVHDSMDGTDLGVRDIASRFIEHHAEEMERKVTPKWVGGIIRRRLGLRTERRGGSYVIPASETSRLEQLYERYGLHAEPETTVSDRASQDIPRTSGL